MKSLVIYDSNFGNTKLVADAIGKALGEDVPVVSIRDVEPAMLIGLDLLVVGSPINAWRPTAAIGTFISGLRGDQLKGCRVATFDTRVRLFIHGDAAKRMSKDLVRAGATLVVEPKAFYVKGKEGPLEDGELIRAAAWANELTKE